MEGEESVSGAVTEEQEAPQETEELEPSEDAQQAAGEDDGAGEDDQSDGEDQSEDRPKSKRRPNKAERRALRAERDRDRLLDALLAERGGSKAQPEPQQQNKPAAAPKQEDFETYEAYIDARVEYLADQRVAEQFAQRQKQTQAQRQQQHQEKLVTEYHQRVDAAQDKYEDFDDVAFSDDVVITAVMRDAMVESEFGPDVQYYLGSNPEESAKIAALSPVAQIRAIGRLETKFAQAEAKAESVKDDPPPRKTTSAPEPIKPIGGKKASGNINPDKLSTEQWMEQRAAGKLNYR
ncbi:hypothetical protein [Denitrobaculum tricleocarpae]|uniref:Scaffolding protein n=1 Tax=Denitrobaculum tricleocarpae TaxID=2591009 RepID=A0A545TSX5_9PROT|nr:hypothetical protein [Denitrobaculum tricleocarpae]TQV80324.1 hypothetical protein FKG95_09010 [Denitrobaculum tricleocarpae]